MASIVKAGQSEEGHTVVEVLVALAILSVALVPTIQFTARVISNTTARDLIIASQLARGEMEKAVLEPNFAVGVTTILLNRKTWRLEQKIDFQNDLVTINIRVFKKNSPKPVVELQTLRLSKRY